jgi:tetratricopeptide (TPR) repeat protein
MNDYLNAAINELSAGNLTEAEALLNKAIEANPQNAEAYFNRGKVKRQRGNFSEAINDFQKALDINPNYNQAKVSIEMVKRIISFRNPDLYNP